MGPGLILALGVFLLYHLTFSSVPTSDGYFFASNIDHVDWDGMLIANSPLSSYFFFSLKRVLVSVGLAAPTLAMMRTVSAIVAALGAMVLYALVRLLGGGTLLGLLGGALLATSFGYWYFANGELHLLSLGVLLLMFGLLLRRRVTGTPYSYGFVVGLALLNAVATLLHQENFLFGLTTISLFVVGRPWRRSLREALVYAIAGSLGTALLVFAIGRFLRGISTAWGILSWYIWIVEYMERPQAYLLGNPLAIIGRVVKGQLTALIFGTQIVPDVVRTPRLLRYPTVDALLAVTLVSYGLVALLVMDLWWTRRLLLARWRIPLVGCAVWFFSYKILLHWWYWPTSTEYHVVTLPPLVLLLLLGPIALRVGGDRPRGRLRVGTGGVAALLALVLAVNYWGGIEPWYRYGRMKEWLTARFQTGFRPDDFFVSTESGVDSIFANRARALPVKDVFLRASKTEAFEVIRTAVATELWQGRRVFVYSFVPSPFAFLKINAYARVREGEMSPLDFEGFLDELRQRYAFRPVLSYWEESTEPLYLFGRRLETLWEITPKAK